MAARVPSPERERALREAFAACLVQLVVLAAFFWTPLSQYFEVHYSAADLTQAMSLTRIEPGHRPGNQLQSDAVTQMQPWVLFNRDELLQGRFPLWNPWNGAGCPHFANYQSAVVSPFSVPFYVMDFKPALLVSAVLKLLMLGIFTYLFLREIGCGWIAAVTGGVMFEFAGHNSLLLYFPHVGAMFALPAGMFFAERALRLAADALREGRSARIVAPIAGLTVSLLVGLLAGNPEPFYFGCWGIGAWITVRILGLWRAHRRDARARVELLRVAGALALGCFLAAGLAAFQVLPFLEYLENSRVLEQRSMRQTPLDPRWWPLLVFPDALGNPSSAYNLSDTIPPPNYELVNMSYVGGAAMLLALLSPFVAWGRRGGRFFFFLAAAWFVYAHDLGGAYDLLAHVPTLDMAPMNRSQGLWNFAVACAAAVGLDALLKHGVARPDWARAGGWLLAAGALLVTALLGTDRLITEFAAVSSPNHRHFLAFVPAHLGSMTLWTAVAALCAAGLWLVRARVPRLVLGVAVGVSAFAQGGLLLSDYNPVSKDKFVFPVTPQIAELQSTIGDERLVILGQDAIPPDSNLVYRIKLLASYDGMWVRHFDHLYRDHFGDGDNWRPVLRGSHRSMKLFGARWVLAKWDWNFLDRGLAEFPKGKGHEPVRHELLPGRTVTQTFHPYDRNLSSVMVVLSTPRNVGNCTVRMRLEEVETGHVVSEQSITGREVQSTVYTGRHVTWPGEYALNPHGRPVVFRFEPHAESADRDFRITLSCEDGRPGESVFAWSMPVLGYGLGRSTYAGQPLAGELLFDWNAHEPRRWESVKRIGDYTLFRLRDAVPSLFVVGQSMVARSPGDALELVRSLSFDPRRLVVLGAGDAETRRHIQDSIAAAEARQIVQFTDSPFCYLVAPDGRTLAHIEDEATFLANRFQWRQVKRLPPSERAKYVILPDEDLDGMRKAGLRVRGPTTERDGPPEILEDTPNKLRLRLNRPSAGHLVLARAFDPGWKATVDGREAPVLRANYAFQAVEIPAGPCEVELRYLPDSLVRGLWIGAASLLAAAACVLSARRRHGAQAALARRPPGRAGPPLPLG